VLESVQSVVRMPRGVLGVEYPENAAILSDLTHSAPVN